jgi:hypothetical protein
MKICPVGAKLICADGWTKISKIIGSLCENVNALNKGLVYIAQRMVFALLHHSRVTENYVLSCYITDGKHTVRSESFRTDFFLNQRHVRKTHMLFIKNKLYWHIYRTLRGRAVSEKVPKIPLFGPSLIHQIWLLLYQQHLQNGVLLTSFSTWGTENNLVEINLESRWVIKGCDIFLGKKLTNTCSFVGGCIIMQQDKISRAECSWTNR